MGSHLGWQHRSPEHDEEGCTPLRRARVTGPPCPNLPTCISSVRRPSVSRPVHLDFERAPVAGGRQSLNGSPSWIQTVRFEAKAYSVRTF
jgi:hypothetical protein